MMRPSFSFNRIIKKITRLRVKWKEKEGETKEPKSGKKQVSEQKKQDNTVTYLSWKPLLYPQVAHLHIQPTVARKCSKSTFTSHTVAFGPKATTLWPGYCLRKLAQTHQLTLLLLTPQTQGSKQGSLHGRAGNRSGQGLHHKMARCTSEWQTRRAPSQSSQRRPIYCLMRSKAQCLAILPSFQETSYLLFSGDETASCHSRSSIYLIFLILKNKN